MLSHREVARRWWQGKDANGCNMFSRNGVIYSFGYHYAIAKEIKGNIFFNIEGYSVTTKKHRSIVMWAMGYPDVLYVRDPREPDEKDIQNHISLAENLIGRIKRARSRKPICIEEFKQHLDQAKKINEVIKVNDKLEFPKTIKIFMSFLILKGEF